MAGSKMGSLKKKMGLKGATKPGEMIARMNAMKNDHDADDKKSKGMKCKSCGMSHKSMACKSSGIKKTGTTGGKSNRLGSGGRFEQVKRAVSGKKGVYNPAGLAAYIGRKSLGPKKMARLAAAGRKRASK